MRRANAILIFLVGAAIVLLFQNCQKFSAKSYPVLAQSIDDEPLVIPYAPDDPVTAIPTDFSDNAGLIVSPKERVVFQRDFPARTQVIGLTVTRAFVEVDRVEVIAYADHRYVKSQAAPTGSPMGVYSLAIPQGGWYRVDVMQFNATNTKAVRSRLERVGIGDVFIIAGQSNAASWGETLTTSASDRAVMYDPAGATWSPLADSMPFTDGGGGSNWPAMADLLIARRNYPIALVNTAIGGTRVLQWQQGQVSDAGLPLFDRLLAVAQAMRAHSGFRMILWHQGEGDVGDAANYATRFALLQTQLDSALGGDPVKWMVAQATFVPADTAAVNCGAATLSVASQALASVQTSLPDGLKTFAGPNGDDLRGDGYRYPGAVGLCVHWTAAAQGEMSRRWAASILAL